MKCRHQNWIAIQYWCCMKGWLISIERGGGRVTYMTVVYCCANALEPKSDQIVTSSYRDWWPPFALDSNYRSNLSKCIQLPEGKLTNETKWTTDTYSFQVKVDISENWENWFRFEISSVSYLGVHWKILQIHRTVGFDCHSGFGSIQVKKSDFGRRRRRRISGSLTETSKALGHWSRFEQTCSVM